LRKRTTWAAGGDEKMMKRHVILVGGVVANEGEGDE